jgi:hypothetical protein
MGIGKDINMDMGMRDDCVHIHIHANVCLFVLLMSMFVSEFCLAYFDRQILTSLFRVVCQ